MRRALRASGAALLATLLAGLPSCSGEAESSGEPPKWTMCPPAPVPPGAFVFNDERDTCEFDTGCSYDYPSGLATGAGSTVCNTISAACKNGRISGQYRTGANCPTPTSYLDALYRWCPEAESGKRCEMTVPDDATDPYLIGNAECLKPGPGSNLSEGRLNGHVCACDMPGPQWRCIPVTQLPPKG